MILALADLDLLGVQAVLYLQHNSNLLEKGTELGEQDLLAFSNIRVSIHHVITDRIDHLRPSQQLTLKVRLPSCIVSRCMPVVLQTEERAPQDAFHCVYWQKNPHIYDHHL